MADISNDFSWSKSRHEKFAECRRAYFYQYYASWGGWEASPGSETRQLYVLKKLSSRWQWAGSVVHESIRQMLSRARATGQFLPIDDMLKRTREKARAQWAYSRGKSYWNEFARIVGLTEHEYGDPVPSEEWKRLYEDVVDGSLRAFYASETFAKIQGQPQHRWMTIDELDSWDFEGTKIWVAIDFAYRDQEGLIHILDWKTGQQRKVDHTQVAIYALYAREKWGVHLDNVMGGLVYLTGSGEAVSVKADEATLETCKDEMRASIGAMKTLLEDPAANRARSLEMFPQHPDPKACARCPFRRPCGRL
jgi:hypothetical protein